MEYVGYELLGTLYMDGIKQRRSNVPNDANYTPTFKPGAKLEIRNSDSQIGYQIGWVKVNIGSKKLLISDSNILKSVSWNDLNDQGLIFGKKVTIDGKPYLLRVLTGGTYNRDGGTNDTHRGGKLPNEWDEIIGNDGKYARLPIPTERDLSGVEMSGEHNGYWRWTTLRSWVQDAEGISNDTSIARGFSSARYWYWSARTSRENFGWRPVLEVLDGPVISGKDEDLGNKTEPFVVSYGVSNPNGYAITIKEIVNGTVLRTHNNKSGSTHFSTSVNVNYKTWENLPVNRKIEIKIEVTDSNNNKIVRTYTFTKVGSPPSAIPVEPKGDLAKIAIVDTINPVLVWRFEDADPGDAQSAYQVIVEDTNNNIVHDSKKIASSQSFYIVPNLNWATRYKWKVRVWDRYDLASSYSSYQFFLPKRRPNVTDVEPGSPNVEEPAGTGTAPEFSWTFEDLDQQAQAAYQLKIYDTKDVLVYDSGRIEKTINQHKVSEGVLSEGAIYYAVVTVWDPFGLDKDSEKAYFVTNSTPTAPTLTSPANTYRTNLRPTFEGLIGHDKENDPQHFVIQLSQDDKFEKHVLELSSLSERKGWQVSNGSQWYDLMAEGIDNSYEGKGVRYTLQVDLDEGRTYYWRMAAIDANTKARGKWSNARCIRCGNTLQFKLKRPIETGSTAARRILIAADYYLANDGINKAQMKIEVTNNALDTNPVWEDATAAYQNADYFTFTNATKTAQQYALDIRVTFKANDSLGAIEMRGLGFSFD